MAIAPTLQRYLAAQNIQFDVIAHEPTLSSNRTAEACRVSGDQIAKAVVLRGDSGYVLAIVPASHHIRVADLRRELGDKVEMASEPEIDRLFPDCIHGAVPPIGQCYGLALIVDEMIEAQADVYFEAGDHETLLHLGHAQFARLMAGARHGQFSDKLPKNTDACIVWG